MGLVTASGCGFSVGKFWIEEDTLEKQVSERLAEEVGETPDKIDCPSRLDGEVGKKMRCTLTEDGDSRGLTITVTEVEGGDISYNVLVDEDGDAAADPSTGPESSSGASAADPQVPEDMLESEISRLLTQQVGQTPDEVDCPGPLDGAPGTTMECTLIDGDARLPVKVEATGIEGTEVKFHFEVLDPNE